MPTLLPPPGRAKLAESVCRASSQPPTLSSLHLRQPFSVSAARLSSDPTPRLPPPPPSRWIAELRARVGKCIIFGCDRQQISRAASVLGALAREWKELLAGSEGFLTGGRRGLEAREIAWGEMDTFVGVYWRAVPLRPALTAGLTRGTSIMLITTALPSQRA